MDVISILRKAAEVTGFEVKVGRCGMDHPAVFTEMTVTYVLRRRYRRGVRWVSDATLRGEILPAQAMLRQVVSSSWRTRLSGSL